MPSKIDRARESVIKKYKKDERYHADVNDTKQRYSLRNKFGFYFEYRKFHEAIKLFNYAGIDFKDKRILDIGCHRGFQLNYLAFLKGESKDLHGIDFIPQFIETAKAINPGINYRKMDVYKLNSNFKDNYFDFINLIYCLNCIPPKDRPQIAQSITDKLKKGGYMLVFDLSDNILISMIRKVVKTIRGLDNRYVEYANNALLRKYFVGCKIVKSKNIINVLSFPLSKFCSYPIIELLDYVLPNNYYIALLKKIR